jgi:hypothetical protein
MSPIPSSTLSNDLSTALSACLLARRLASRFNFPLRSTRIWAMAERVNNRMNKKIKYRFIVLILGF